MNIFTRAPIFCTYLTICSFLEDVEAYSGRSNLQANCLSDFDALFVGLSHDVACTISHSFFFVILNSSFVHITWCCLRTISHTNDFNSKIFTTDTKI